MVQGQTQIISFSFQSCLPVGRFAHRLKSLKGLQNKMFFNPLGLFPGCKKELGCGASTTRDKKLNH
jgi:hypothetical protein